ncbi:MAG: hypothetical protein RL240_2699 [Planctomycetota bacterium]|jgi:uncharacterized GH25 family protein
MNKQSLSLSWFFAVVIIVASMTDRSMAHDTWVQSGPLVTRRGDVVHVDLMLGNHGNEHRDFKLASKITLAPCIIQLINPDGTKVDIKPLLKDMGSAEKEGYWSGRVIPEHSGVYQVIHTLNTLHGKTRAIKSSKTFFIAAEGFSSLPQNGVEQIQPLKQGLELVLITPLSEVVAGKPLTVKVLQHGRPLPNTSVAFIPRGSILVEGKDPNFERVSDENGIVAFVPPEGNLLLVVAHHVAPNESGDGYDKTHYGATLVLPVPQLPYAK